MEKYVSLYKREDIKQHTVICKFRVLFSHFLEKKVYSY